MQPLRKGCLLDVVLIEMKLSYLAEPLYYWLTSDYFTLHTSIRFCCCWLCFRDSLAHSLSGTSHGPTALSWLTPNVVLSNQLIVIGMKSCHQVAAVKRIQMLMKSLLLPFHSCSLCLTDSTHWSWGTSSKQQERSAATDSCLSPWISK